MYFAAHNRLTAIYTAANQICFFSPFIDLCQVSSVTESQLQVPLSAAMFAHQHVPVFVDLLCLLITCAMTFYHSESYTLINSSQYLVNECSLSIRQVLARSCRRSKGINSNVV